MSRRRPAADPTTARRQLDDIEAAAHLAYLAADTAMYELFTATADAGCDALARARRILDGGHRAAVEQNTAEMMAWTPVVHQVHGLAQRWLNGDGRHAGAAAPTGPATAAMLRADHDHTAGGASRD